jgi:hypothetical protein
MRDQSLNAEDAGLLQASRMGDNALLRVLDGAHRAALAPHLELVPFRNGDMIARAGDPGDSICFPLTGIAAVLDSLEGDRRYAVTPSRWLGMRGLSVGRCYSGTTGGLMTW